MVGSTVAGIVVRVFPERHFLFIKYEGGEIFGHEDNWTYTPSRGDRVEFEVGTHKGRPTALKIRLAAQETANE
jgi:hypothetical protein